MINWPQLAYGILTYVPGVSRLFRGGAGRTLSARYCYTVWMRHFLLGVQQGLTASPKVVAELGPGNSLGVGLAALLSGSDRYLAFDVAHDASPERNLKIFDELVVLFQGRSAVPGDDELPGVLHKLESYAFPSAILTDARLDAALAPDRLERIRDAIRNTRAGSMIDYRAPWDEDAVMQDGVIDLVFSQAVLAHANHLGNAYRAMSRWVRPAGLLSHQIDFRCLGTAREWNGHWTLSDTVWKLITGKRLYMLNRQPYSTHVALLKEHGFSLVGQHLHRTPSRIDRAMLAPRFAHLTDDDLTISSAFMQSIKN